MRRVSTVGTVLVLALLALGCDSGEEDRPDAEVFVGTWKVAKIEDSQGDKTAQFQQSGDLTATFDAQGNLTLAVDRPTGQPDISLTGTYTVNEALGTLTLNASITNPVTGQPATIPLPADYEIVSEDEIVLSVSQATIGLIAIAIQSENIYVGEVRITVRRA